MIKKLFCIFFLYCLCSCSNFNVEKTNDFTLNLIHTNDLHSHLLPFDNTHDCAPDSDCLGGFARLITFLKQKESSSTLILDAGDRFTGTFFYTLTKSKYLLPLFKEMPYDAVTLGNHEFDDNLPETVFFFQNWIVPVVVANLKISETEALFPLIKPSVILEKEGHKIGIIGVLTPETDILNNHNISVTPVFEAVSKEINFLKQQGVNIIIVLSHIGLASDKRLAKEYPEIDVIVGGHSHSLLNNDSKTLSNGKYPIEINQGKTLIVTSGMGGQYIGQLQVTFDAKGDIIKYQGNTVPMTKEITNDPRGLELIETAQEQLESVLTEPIAFLENSIDFSLEKNYCDKDCPIGKYLTHVLHTAYPAIDGVLLNSGSIRKGLPAGKILYQNLLDVLPFDDEAVLIQLTGSELKEFIEHGIADYRTDMKTNALLQTSGVDYDFSPKDKRIKNILINGNTLDLDKKYTFLTSHYIANGGDRYPKVSYKKTNFSIHELLKKQINLTNLHTKQLIAK